MKRIYIDPPEGWKYGFPKSYEEGNPPRNLNKWLTDNGYPAQAIIDYGDKFYVRTWEEEKEKSILDHFFNDDNYFLNASKKESYLRHNVLFIWLPPANDTWYWKIMDRAKIFCEEINNGMYDKYQHAYPRGNHIENYMCIQLQ